MPRGIIPKTAFKKGRIPWNKNLKGLQPWHNISGLLALKGQHQNKGRPTPWARNNPQTFKKGMIPWNKGGKETRQEVIKKMKESHKGRKHTEIQKRKIGENNKGKHFYWLGIKGKKTPNWKGGITPENAKIRNSIEFRLWREAVFARDNWTCQKYGIKGGKLHPHHIQNFAQFLELRFAIDNGITLSDKAHREFHKKYGIKNNTTEQINQFIYG